MRNIVPIIIIMLLTDLFFQRCASIGSPTGGPRDTIPPILVESIPTNGTTNFNSQEFELVFSEFVKADKIQQQLIITPRVDNKYKTVAKRNTILIKFTDPFADSTTYNLNFADGITDITESNPAVNLSLAFSTGAFIDSLSLEGNVLDLFEQEPVQGYLVGIYPITDTLDYFKEKPLYFTSTNDSGYFQLNYIKSGDFKLLVFNDDNSNIILDPETEAHGFISDSILLDSSIIFEKPIHTLLQNIKPIAFINARPTGPYIELKYNKTIDQYSIEPEYLHHSITGESKDVIRIYSTEEIQPGDSITLIANVSDSLANQARDTIKTAFVTSNRKPSEFTYYARNISGVIKDEIHIEVNFNKPIDSIDSTKIYLSQDSTFKWPIPIDLVWNDNKTILNMTSQLDPVVLVDTLLSRLPEDTSTDNTTNPREPLYSIKDLDPITFTLDSAAFISVEGDTSILQLLRIPFVESSSYGTIKLNIISSYPSFNLQLLDRQGQVKYNAWSQNSITFPRVTPGEYSIRILIDNNEDGKWSAGNLLLNSDPEEVYLHHEATTVRENWVLEIDLSF